MKTITVGKAALTIDQLVSVARNGARVSLDKEAETRISATRHLVEKWVEEEKTIYGITTGFGALSNVLIGKKDARKLQENILMSHCAGVGDFFAPEIVRGMILIRIEDLCRGHSGIRPETVSMLVEFLNRDICPMVPEKGSVGASGDLVPLAHTAIVLLGMGEAMVRGKRMTGKEALERCGLSPIRLEAAEGLALINGTQCMTAIGALAVADAIHLTKMADIAASMSLEVLMGSRMEFDPRIHGIRPHPGQIIAAENMAVITAESEIISSHKDCKRVQDAYTLRCSPQVHGASRDAVAYAENVIKTEMNSATGNPLIFSDTTDVLTGGNFHGQPVALAMDFMCMAVAELANISERRIERLVNPKLSGLPAFLVKNSGLDSGLMIAQYTAAALVSENKVFCHPACVDSIPTSANKEDHVSMGTISARKCREVIANVENVLSIELFCAAQALDLFTDKNAGKGTRKAYAAIREIVPHLETDRILSKDMESIRECMVSGRILSAVEERTGPLG